MGAEGEEGVEGGYVGGGGGGVVGKGEGVEGGWGGGRRDMLQEKDKMISDSEGEKKSAKMCKQSWICFMSVMGTFLIRGVDRLS